MSGDNPPHKSHRETISRIESEKDALLLENIALREQSEALSNAAQAIGLTLQGRLKDVEARHEAEMLRGNIANADQAVKKDKKKKTKTDKYRDFAFFLAGTLTGAAFAVLLLSLIKRS